MLNRHERNVIKNQIADLKRKLDSEYEEEFWVKAKTTEEKFLGRCFKSGNKYYRIISVLTPECPSQLWAVMFDVNSGLKPLPIGKKLLSVNEYHSYEDFEVEGVKVIKLHNNLRGTPDTTMEEISQEQFLEAYSVMSKNLETCLLQTF